jgi:UDP-glucose 4-epimerase
MSASPPSSTPPAVERHILVTGGVGYIGSHTVVALLLSGARVTIVDNLSNSNPIALERIAVLAGGRKPTFHQVDIRDAKQLEEKVFKTSTYDACIHFAGLKVSRGKQSGNGSGAGEHRLALR